MRTRLALLLLFVAAALPALGSAGKQHAAKTIVPPWARVSSFQARFELAKLLSYKHATADQSLHHIALLLDEQPENVDVHIVQARALMQMGKFRQAMEIATKVRESTPQDGRVLLELANLETELGHFKIAKTLYEQALSKSEGIDPEWKLTYAGARQRWGEFPQAIDTYESYLQEYPQNVRVRRLLASALAGQQRYDEAEQILWKTYYSGDHTESLLELARIRAARGDDEGALGLLDHIQVSGPHATQVKSFQAELLAKECQKDEALHLFEELAQSAHDPYDRAFYLQRAAAIAHRYEDSEEVGKLIEEASKITPEAVSVRYWQHPGPWDLQEIVDQANSPQELAEWANRFAEDGCLRAAVWLNDAATHMDAGFYPSRVAMANLYAGLLSYGNAEEVYLGLLCDFPDNFTFTHHYTRLLSWDKRYEVAYCFYDTLIDNYPDNPVLKMDQARMAIWWQKGGLARTLYEEILEYPVDALLPPSLSEDLALSDCDGIYSRYESMLNAFGWPDCLESSNIETTEALLDFWALYRIQKTCYLEMQAEFASWGRCPLSATYYWQELCDFVPGDISYLFNQSQTWCGLGMCQVSTPMLQHLLWKDPNHPTVNRALARRAALDRPQAVGQYTYWHEDGYGVLTGITRQKYRIGLDHPCGCLSSFRLYYDNYRDRTILYPRNFNFDAITAEYQQIYSPYTSGFLSLSAKLGGNYQLRHKWLGEARLESRLQDRLNVAMGCNRADEFYNNFGIENGVQSTTFWTRANWLVNRWLLIEPEYQYRLYTDHNSANIALLNIAYQITEYPTTLRLLFQGEYRNAAFTNQFIYEGNTLVNIIHPYWAPQRYFAGRAGIEFLQNLETLSFCNAEQHYWKARFMVVEDNEDNLGGSASLEWRREWDNRWSLWLSAVIHRSRQWNAEGLWSGLNLRY